LSYKIDIQWINIGLIVPHFSVSNGMGKELVLKVNMNPEQGIITILILQFLRGKHIIHS